MKDETYNRISTIIMILTILALSQQLWKLSELKLSLEARDYRVEASRIIKAERWEPRP